MTLQEKFDMARGELDALGNRIEILSEILKDVDRVFSQRAHQGCKEKTWEKFQNGNGVDVGLEMEKVLQKVKEAIK